MDTSLKQLVKDLFYYLDMTEESDSGRVFHPTIITSCRAMDQESISEILKQMKQEANKDETN